MDVDGDLHEKQLRAMRTVFAQVTAAPDRSFDRAELTVTVRPEPAPWPFTAMVVGFGSGTVAYFEERYVEWARAHAPTPHQRASYMVIALATEAGRRGEQLDPMPPMMGWALARTPAAPVPAGYRIERVDRDWMQEWQRRDVFTNALGHSAQVHRTFRNSFAHVAFDDAGEPVAAAGVYDTAGLSEVGVDVLAQHRGSGLSIAVVSAAARSIVDEGATAYYGCEVTNIPSQRTALGSGFLPACSLALAMGRGIGT
jgi:hypothetical protein